MIRPNRAAIAAAAVLACSLPAFAQSAAPMPATPNSSTGKMLPDTNMSCQAMMDHANPMMGEMAAGRKKRMAMNHMNMAKASMTAGDETACRGHMDMVMKDMM